VPYNPSPSVLSVSKGYKTLSSASPPSRAPAEDDRTFHRERASVFVSQEPQDGWNVDPAFDCRGRKQMAQVVMRDAGDIKEVGRSIHALLTFVNAKDKSVVEFVGSLLPHGRKEGLKFRNHGHMANFPIFGAR
jgi:hypothetical protein